MPRSRGAAPTESAAAADPVRGSHPLGAALEPVLRRRRALEAGHRAEQDVAERLAAQGWTVLAQNWRGGGGELDVVVLRGRALRFVEVKLRALEDPLVDEAIPAHKRAKLRGAARAFLLANPVEADDLAFLVAFVAPDGSARWVDDAFDG
jgi:putative endonuclease